MFLYVSLLVSLLAPHRLLTRKQSAEKTKISMNISRGKSDQGANFLFCWRLYCMLGRHLFSCMSHCCTVTLSWVHSCYRGACQSSSTYLRHILAVFKFHTAESRCQPPAKIMELLLWELSLRSIPSPTVVQIFKFCSCFLWSWYYCSSGHCNLLMVM